MAFTLYSLIEAALLCINAIAILNEQRFLSKLSSNGQFVSGYGNEPGPKIQALNLIRSVRTVMRIPLIAFNIITVFFLILFG